MLDLRLHNVLVALDGSPGSDLALAAAVAAVQRDHAHLTLLSVAPDVIAETARWASPAAAVPAPALQQDADAEAGALLRRAADELPQDLPVTLRVRRGRAAQEILAQAREHDYDALFLGARGRGRVGSLLGSVSQEVLHHAPTRVFVAHEPRE